MSTGLAIANGYDGGEIREYSPVSGVARVTSAMDTMKAIRTFVLQELVLGHDFGTIPGAGDKKVLLQPGAQKIIAFFEAYGDQQVERTELGGGHVEFTVTSSVTRWANGQKIGTGIGSCSTMESKYRFRNANRTCPKCGKEALLKSKNDGEGFFCWKKKEGCGATFSERDPAIISQVVGKVENENPHDMRNTVLKMACKRSLVAASLSLGCASDLFTQDLDENDTYDMSLAAVGAGGYGSFSRMPPDESAPRRPAPNNAAPNNAAANHSAARDFEVRLDGLNKIMKREVKGATIERGVKKGYPAAIAQWSDEQVAESKKWLDAILKKDEAQKASTPAAATKSAPQAEVDPGRNRNGFRGYLENHVEEANAWWATAPERIEAGAPESSVLIGSVFQLSKHLIKWAKGRSLYTVVGKPTSMDEINALADLRAEHGEEIEAEIRRYLGEELPSRLKAQDREPGQDG